MRNYNGYGSITKLSGNRRRPWMVRITAGWDLSDKLQARQIQKVLGYYATRQEAIKALADYNNNPFDVNALKITFGQCYEEAKKKFTEGRKQNYYAAYKYLEPIKDMPIRQIKAPMMQKCIDSCTTTQQREIVTVCHKVFDYALEMEYIDKNPSQHIHNNTVAATINRNIFTADEIQFIEEADTWYKVVLACLLYSGMRCKELRTLEPDDIDLENMTIDIRQAKNKSSIRKIPLHTHAEPYFRVYKDEGLVSYPTTQNGLNKAIKKNFEIEHHAHDTRHTFATRMRECGCDPLILQKILGHTPQTITERIYTHLTMEEMRDNIELLAY